MAWFSRRDFVDGLAHSQAVALGTGGDGFQMWRGAELALPPTPLKVVTKRPGWAEEFEAAHAHRVEVPAQGVYHLHDCILRNNGEIEHGDIIVGERQHLGDVAVEWASNREFKSAPNTIIVQSPGVSIIGPGYKVYGHWLVDFIPKIMNAINIFGSDLGGRVIPIPRDTPDWAFRIVKELCPVHDDVWFYFDGQNDQLQFANLFVPTFAHASSSFHPWLSEYLAAREMGIKTRKLYVSRKNFGTSIYGVVKHFGNQDAFESEALSRGYEIVFPETMTFQEQIALFGTAKVIVGEYGSALHSAMFSPSGAVCGMIRCPNDIQLRIAAMRGQSSVVLFPEIDVINEDTSASYSINDEEISSFFNAVWDLEQ